MNTKQALKFDVISLDQMNKVAFEIVKHLVTPLTISLKGDLGAGKTTLVQFILKQLGYIGKVKSPTYNIIENYSINNLNIFHIDLYRINSPEELEYLAMDEIFSSNSIRFIEWYENAQQMLAKPDIIIEIKHNKNTRNINIII